MKNRTLTVTFVISLLLMAAIGAWCADNQLTVTQDERSMELTIERYLESTHQMIIEEKTFSFDENDLYLNLPFAGDPMPKFRVEIDTQSLNRDKDTNQVLERGILINIYTGVHIQKEDMEKALTAINEWNYRKAFASIFIDKDGEVVCCWVLNVLSEGLATEYVYDAVVRVQANWKGLFPELMAAIKHS